MVEASAGPGGRCRHRRRRRSTRNVARIARPEANVVMRKLWAVVQREYMERVRTRWFVLATVFGPIVFGSLMYLPAYMATRSRASQDVARIRILDATQSDLGRRVATSLNGGLFGDTTRTRVENVTAATLAA